MRGRTRSASLRGRYSAERSASAAWQEGQSIPLTRPSSSLITFQSANCGRFDGGTGRPQPAHLERSGGIAMSSGEYSRLARMGDVPHG